MKNRIDDLETEVRLLKLQIEALTLSLDKVTKERNLFFKQKKENIAIIEGLREKLWQLT